MSGSNVPPALTVQSNGQGVLSDQELNTFVQGGALLADLRSFVGLSRMTVQMIGTATPGDGGQGTFYWNTTSTTADDGGATAIQVNGILIGRWLRISNTVQGPSSSSSGDVVAFTNTTGTQIGDAGFKASSISPTVATISALQSATISTLPVAQCWLAGHSSTGDGGQGNFWFNSADTSTADNGGTIIVDASNRRWYRDYLGPVWVEWFGGGTAASSNTAALTAALAVSENVQFGTGTYVFASGVSHTLSSATATLSVKGAGSEQTILSFSNGSQSGIAIYLLGQNNSVHIRDLTVACQVVASSGIGVYVSQTATTITNPAETQTSDITNVTIRGSDGLAMTNCWTQGVVISGASCFNFTNLLVGGPSGKTGDGVNIYGTSSVVPVAFNFTGCTFNNLNIGVAMGAWVQGVTISQCNFTYCKYGAHAPAQSSGVALAQFTIANSQFNCSINAILTLVGVPGLMISSNFFIPTSGSVCISITAFGNATISANTFFGLGTTSVDGIDIVTSTGYGTIEGNQFLDMGGAAIRLQSGSSGVNVQSNSYQSCGTNVVNSGTSNTVGGGSS